MNTAQNFGLIRLGAVGWTHPAWTESFYPVDMPEDWRLSYFNTQFHCVFLAQGVWQQASSDQRAQWQADTHDDFRFLLECDAPLQLPPEFAGRALLISRDDARIYWFKSDSSLKDMAAVLSGAAQPRYLISIDGDMGQMERVATLLEVMGLAG